MADIWKAYGEAHIGRIYCEEFHPACYSHYAFDYGHVNLGMTLTQEKDEYCDFNVVLRAENLPDDLKPKCFAEYDPGYVAPDVHPDAASGKAGFECISVKLYYYILEAVLEQLGEPGWISMAGAMEKMAVDGAQRARKTAARYDRLFDEQIVFDTYPLTLDRDKTQMWTGYSSNKSVERFEKTFVTAMRRELKKI